MTAMTLRALLDDTLQTPCPAQQRHAGRDPARAPVRGQSYKKDRHGAFFRPFKASERSRYLLAAERFEYATKEAGKRNGALGQTGLQVLRELLRFIDFKTGRLDPAIDTLATRIRRARATVVAALKRLRDSGFLDWIRRYEPTYAEGFAPQVRQISNAYRLSLPARALALLGRLAEAPPPPDDWEQHKAEQLAVYKAYVASLPTHNERLQADGVPDDLAQVLGRLFDGIEKKEAEEAAANA